jgi:hypothetical protein
MTAKHDSAEPHASAAIHHAAAARFHREASRHYQVGKDHAHAAHQALLAHGHGLRAIERGYEASAYYATLNVSEHHAAAADHHEQAARHHGQAAKHRDEKDFALAAHEAQIAHGHAQHSVFHDNEAAKHHVEHYGKSGPTAEIS